MAERAVAPADADVVELTTVGIDVGSATYHLSISRVRLERRATALSTRFDVVARHRLAASPVQLTPYRDDTDAIDVTAVAATVRRCYEAAGTTPDAVDSGVVLLTGAALARANARALAEELAGSSGRFVCAAAGHHFEAVLAAHGSGAVARSAGGDGPVIALDIGGATTKLAVAVEGEVTATAALVAGGRLLAWDDAGRLTRIEAAVLPVARQVGWCPAVGDPVDPGAVARLCARLADAIVAPLDPGAGDPAGAGDLALTPPLPLPAGRFTLVASGGVAEYLAHPEQDDHDDLGDRSDHGDLGPALAAAVRDRLGAAGLEDRLRPATQRIRATVVGASQFSTQVSGSTIHLGDRDALPLHHVPVVRPTLPLRATVDATEVSSAVRRAVAERLDAQGELDDPPALAVAVRWEGPPEHGRLLALAEGLHRGTAELLGDRLLVVAVDRDLGATVGRLLVEEAGAAARAVLSLDGLDLADLDHLDVGRPTPPAGVVPVVVKSLLFSTAGGALAPPSPDRSAAPDRSDRPAPPEATR